MDIVEIQAIYYMVAATGVLIAAVFYILNLRISQRNQELMLKAQEQSTKAQQLTLDTRQAQLFMNVFQRYDKEFWRDWLDTMSKDYRNYEEWDRDRSDPDINSTRLHVGSYIMGIGTMVKRGLLSPEIVSDIMRGPVVLYWRKYSPFIREYRVRANWPTYGQDMEYLYEALMRIAPDGYSPEWVPGGAADGLRERR